MAHTTFCPLDCPDACSLDARVEDGRLVALDGDRRNPVTAGFICAKVRGFSRHAYGDERLLQPARRRGPKGSGELEPIGWDEALDTIARKLIETRDTHGGAAILPLSYGGSNGLLSQDTTDARLFRRLGSLRLARTVCAAATTRAYDGLYGKMPGVGYEDYEHARLIVLWGVNPSESGIHLVPAIRRAKARGARLVVVDPRRTRLAAQADLHLQLRPGTDLPVALALLRWTFDQGVADRRFLDEHTTGADELARRAARWSLARAAHEAGIDVEELTAFARLYAESSPALIRCGWGLERNRNGGSAVAAVLALPAVAGKFGVRGGGFTMSNSKAWRFSNESAIAADEPDTREINMNRVGRALTDAPSPGVRLLFVYNCNPLATLPDQERVRAGLERDDLFTVVFDQVHTDTARYADIVLPATTFLEHAELGRGYGAYVLQRSRPVVDPVGEARPNHEVFAELCRRTGLERDGDPVGEALVERILDSVDDGARLREELADDGTARPGFGTTPVQMVDVHPGHAEGKVHLVPEELDHESPGGLYHYRPDPRSSRYPLALISPATHRTVSSTFGQLVRDQVPVHIHPTDATARGIQDGDAVRVFNELGEVECLAKVDPRMRGGVLSLPKGLWSHSTLNGRTSNALVPDSLTDLGGGACFNDARVQVARRG